MSGNKRYLKYFEQDTGQLTILNLMEIYYAMLRDYGESDAAKAYSSASTYKVEFDDRDAQEAMKKRLGLRQRKRLDLSYADSLGYHLSLKHKIKFLTGDTAFKELENVEYVK